MTQFPILGGMIRTNRTCTSSSILKKMHLPKDWSRPGRSLLCHDLTHQSESSLFSCSPHLQHQPPPAAAIDAAVRATKNFEHIIYSYIYILKTHLRVCSREYLQKGCEVDYALSVKADGMQGLLGVQWDGKLGRGRLFVGVRWLGKGIFSAYSLKKHISFSTTTRLYGKLLPHPVCARRGMSSKVLEIKHLIPTYTLRFSKTARKRLTSKEPNSKNLTM